ncbi:aminopeptidase [Brevibacillus fluminis]|uniref:Aminopeptidase n=1 Tax=Brevibacillus fluminis TaxID=511487 RepID=A0A3M8CWK0_9BACL|nr:aminopeptidase [Brevibacillus fluminis]RNB79741.1 aminopeptidase [Brevibacillus fluminis]
MDDLRYSGQYADVLVNAALKIKKGDELVVILPEYYKSFGELLRWTAQDAGAKAVNIFYEDQEKERDHYLSGRTDKYRWLFDEQFDEIEKKIQNDARLLVLRSTRFGIFSQLSPEQLKLRNQYYRQDFGRIFYYVQGNKVAYCLGALPNSEWASLVFPDEMEEVRIKRLWDKMSRAIYLDRENPVQFWNDRMSILNKRKQALDLAGFEKIVVSGPDTWLEIELPVNHLWQGGTHSRPNGRDFIPNIPTEEVYTIPKRDGVNGRLTNRHRTYFINRTVDEHTLFFHNGELTKVESPDEDFAAEFVDWLSSMPGAKNLGEFALVSNSGVKDQGVYFYEPVYDENASCHFAFGSGYRSNIKGGEEMTDEEFLAHGGNLSPLHMDFMYDSCNMVISGVKHGELTRIIDQGQWVYQYDEGEVCNEEQTI